MKSRQTCAKKRPKVIVLDGLAEFKAKHGEEMGCVLVPSTVTLSSTGQQMLGPHAMRLRSGHIALVRRLLASQACCLGLQIVLSSLQTQCFLFLPVHVAGRAGQADIHAALELITVVWFVGDAVLASPKLGTWHSYQEHSR